MRLLTVQVKLFVIMRLCFPFADKQHFKRSTHTLGHVLTCSTTNRSERSTWEFTKTLSKCPAKLNHEHLEDSEI